MTFKTRFGLIWFYHYTTLPKVYCEWKIIIFYIFIFIEKQCGRNTRFVVGMFTSRNIYLVEITEK